MTFERGYMLKVKDEFEDDIEIQLELKDILAVYERGCKGGATKKVGIEFERLPISTVDLKMVDYASENGVYDLLRTFAKLDNWEYITDDYNKPEDRISEEPNFNNLYSIKLLEEMVASKLIGKKLDSNATKNRGQSLERMTLGLLGYEMTSNEKLVGGFPDIPNQLLEVKVQDAQTVDLGKFTPEKEEVIVVGSNLTTFDVRYMIALTDPKTDIIEGIILAPGEKLGEIFTYVSDMSYKCQRTIPMEFFNSFKGQCVFNP